MTTITCLKYGPEQAEIPYRPYPGELGKKIKAQVSLKFWQEWLTLQTMIINENHLSPMDPAHRKLLEEKMHAFLFEGKDVTPEGFSED